MAGKISGEHQDLADVVDKQISLLSELHDRISKKEEIDESRRKQLYRVILKAGAFGGAIAGMIFGSIEAAGFIYEEYQRRASAAEYAEIAQSIYHVENSPSIAVDLINQAIELDDLNVYREELLYYQSMEVVRELLNLDRPFNQDELNRAQSSLAQAMLLRNSAPESAKSHILLGQIYIVLDQSEKAVESLKEAVRLEPNNEFAHMRLGTLLDSQGKNEEALKELDKSIQINPEYKWAYLWKGVLLGEKFDKWNEAREMYKKAIEIDPRFDIAFYNLGWSYVQAEPSNFEEARKQFEQAIKIRPSYKEAFYGLGMMYGYMNEYGVAENYLSKAVSLDENYLTGWKWRGVVRTEQENWEGALEDYSQAISLNPVDESLYLRRGFVYEYMEKYDLAASDYRFAVERDPNNSEAWISMASLSIKVSEYEGAKKQIDKALEIEPDYEEIYALKATLYEKQGDIDASISALDKALSMSTYRPERFLVRKAGLLVKKEKYQQAMELYTKAREEDEGLKSAWLGEGNIAEKLGSNKKAIEAWSRYLELAPEDVEVRKKRDSIIEN